MKLLTELISGLEPVEIRGNMDIGISGVVYDSRKVSPGSLFVCIKGFVTDGHQYISQAISYGATAVLLEDGALPNSVTAIRVQDTRKALAKVSASFFGDPANNLSIVGITGTKGKTTTAFMTDSVFAAAGIRNTLIGTILTRIGDETLQSSRTTPESFDLQEIFFKSTERGIRSCVMEVSSQGLKLDRVYGCLFETAVFTNLYDDHIGPAEHPDMEDYLISKSRIFDNCLNAVVNIDDPSSSFMLDKISCHNNVRLVTAGINAQADVRACDIRKSDHNGHLGISFQLSSPWYDGDVFVGIPGIFNVYNALCAIACAGIRGVTFEAVKNGLSELSIKGRVQSLPTGRDFRIIVDYAHNAASLESLLTTLRGYTDQRLICVFGCGGNRARSRRYEMGKVSGRLADFTVITSDNPRKEPPEEIISDIEKGIRQTAGGYIKITDRTEAIRSAIGGAGKGDIIVIAGKGHETYQEFADRTIHYDDYEVASAILEGITTK
ncbi:MAG: UDP-N-acetylmuramoyl-L-alanyl-D-glutamate--2,6-diaminopimelate ligase [Eubacteriales bacterium]|nr:UDP-N-acetylmuramoyl-L-alanyl-D-glutamate--2,6-diaminopimelate ligase [Eubacteriales bacterium]MDD4326607.1 UDP-N-acetylmuramoyl-L-alanyl-D-glutamate--2,6-diaminopimelate ligase [Eubacteriales bacterium]